MITAITTATITIPSRMTNQSDIVCSLLTFDAHLPRTLRRRSRKAVRVLLRILMSRDGQGMDPVTDTGKRRHFRRVCWRFASLQSVGGCGATAADCAAARSPFMREQLVAGVDEIAVFVARYVSAASRPYLRSRPYSCVRVSPSRLAARDLLPRVSRITCRMV
jgi:hypothetical protein